MITLTILQNPARMCMQTHGVCTETELPNLGTLELIRAFSRLIKKPITVRSIGPSHKEGIISTRVKLKIGHLYFRSNDIGTWKERDQALLEKLAWFYQQNFRCNKWFERWQIGGSFCRGECWEEAL